MGGLERSSQSQPLIAPTKTTPTNQDNDVPRRIELLFLSLLTLEG